MHVWEFTFENQSCHSFYGFLGKHFTVVVFVSPFNFFVAAVYCWRLSQTHNWACETIMYAWKANNVERGVERVVRRRLRKNLLYILVWAFVVSNIQVYETHLCCFPCFFFSNFFQCFVVFATIASAEGVLYIHTHIHKRENMRSLQWHNCYSTRTITTKSFASWTKKYNKCFRLQA